MKKLKLFGDISPHLVSLKAIGENATDYAAAHALIIKQDLGAGVNLDGTASAVCG